jgi:hypothetical protein
MGIYYKIRQLIYTVIFNIIEFIFFFTHYWWWKLNWLLIKHYLTESGFKIYEKEKQKFGDIENLKEINFAFGETTALSTKLILQDLNPRKGSVIYDLGSGRGVFLFSSYFLNDLKGRGTELFETYVNKSCQIQKSMKIASIMFKQGNITDVDLSEADIVYLAGATFQESVMDGVKENLKKLKPEAVVLTVRQTLPEEDFILFNRNCYPFSWGSDIVYFYRKK